MATEPGSKWEKLDWLKGDGPAGATGPVGWARQRPPERVEIAYGPSAGKLVLGVLFFGFVAAFMAHEARTNDRGLILGGLIELSTPWATVFYWVISATGVAFVLLALLLVPRCLVRRHIVLEKDAITIPSRTPSRRVYRIARGDIRDVSVRQYRHLRYVKIYHAGGVRPINSTWLPHEWDLDVILEWLRAH